MVDGLENIIVSFYAKGMSNSDIEEQIRELYGFDVSTSTISRITDAVTNDIVAWQNRPLESVYLIVWMDEVLLHALSPKRVIVLPESIQNLDEIMRAPFVDDNTFVILRSFPGSFSRTDLISMVKGSYYRAGLPAFKRQVEGTNESFRQTEVYR